MSALGVGGPGARAFYLAALRARLSNEIKPLLSRRDVKCHCHVAERQVIPNWLLPVEETLVALFNRVTSVTIPGEFIRETSPPPPPVSLYPFKNFSALDEESPGRKVRDRPKDSMGIQLVFVKQREPRKSHLRLSKCTETPTLFASCFFFPSSRWKRTQYQSAAARTKTLMLFLPDALRTQSGRRDGFLMVFRNASFMPFAQNRLTKTFNK